MTKKNNILKILDNNFKRYSNNNAIIYQNQIYTYSELQIKVYVLATIIKEWRLPIQSSIVIIGNYNPLVIFAILAVMYAGHHYVILDPSSPKEKINDIIKFSANAIIYLENKDIEDYTKYNIKSYKLSLDTLNKENIGATENIDYQGELQAYTVFTSGTTNKPKGVMIAHQSLYNYVKSFLETVSQYSLKSFGISTTFAADLCYTTLFGALCSGAELYIYKKSILQNPEEMSSYISKFPVDCIKMVPTQIAGFETLGLLKTILPNKLLILGGEKLPYDLAYKIFNIKSKCIIMNHYGPCEATVGTTYQFITQKELEKVVPIGKCFTHTKVYILDDKLKKIKTSRVGEIYIEGNNLSIGYLNNPELTAQKFIPNPYNKSNNYRLYKTGDFGYMTKENKLVFVERKDNQIKINGYRVETKEIINILLNMNNIDNAYLYYDKNFKILVAFLQCKSSKKIINTDLIINHLKQKLPNYMLPHKFMIINKFPYNENGKLDLKKLKLLLTDKDVEYEKKDLSTEEIIIKTWKKILNINDIDTNKSFYDLGGDSFKMLAAFSELKSYFSFLKITDIFQYPNINLLTNFIKNNM